ncbi:MAG: hypothetical protein WA949_12390 [Phormidesmis sp.]
MARYQKPQKRKPQRHRKQSVPTIFWPVGIAIAVFFQQDMGGRLLAKIKHDFARSTTGSQVEPVAADPASSKAPAPATNCNIKGNISISSGRRIYHLPGMEDYENTKIEAKHGERWFCSEADAISNGWQKAPR